MEMIALTTEIIGGRGNVVYGSRGSCKCCCEEGKVEEMVFIREGQ